MIKCNLSILMGKKKIRSFLQLEKATGINRDKLSQFYDDEWISINQEQLNTLCKFFNCQPGDLFEYTPD